MLCGAQHCTGRQQLSVLLHPHEKQLELTHPAQPVVEAGATRHRRKNREARLISIVVRTTLQHRCLSCIMQLMSYKTMPEHRASLTSSTNASYSWLEGNMQLTSTGSAKQSPL